MSEMILPLIVILSIFGIFVLPSLIALLDISKSDFQESSHKPLWIVVVIITGVFGAVLYFLVGRSQKLSDDQ